MHHLLDQAVLQAYGWHDLAAEASPMFLNDLDEPEYRYQKRLFWPAAFRDVLLTRLLALNSQRASEDAAAGLAPPPPVVDEDIEEEADDLADTDA